MRALNIEKIWKLFSRYLEVLQTSSKKLLQMKRKHFSEQFRICSQRTLSFWEIFGNNRNKKDTHNLNLNSRYFREILGYFCLF
jgi:hypothetical protein